MRAVVIEQYGDPKAVLSVRDIPTPEPRGGEVLIKMAASPINPSDVVFVEGNYGYRKTLPAIPGSEGVGTVVAANAGVYGRWLVGKRVSCAAPDNGGGTWAEYMTCSAMACAPLRASTSLEFGAMLLANPVTAVSLVAMAQRHSRGGFIQTAAGSALGRMTARWARHRGVPAIHVARSEAAVAMLRAAGEDYVLVSSAPDFDDQLAALARGLNATIAFDAVGGAMTRRLATALPWGGRVVMFGGLSGEAAQLDVRDAVFEAKSIEGFWLPFEIRRIGTLGLLRRVATVQRMGEAMFGAPVLARLPYERIGEAIALQPRGTEGKVLLVP
jgi:NADPH:quinone reductase-like Zn-dependent oxidoreductase